MRFSTILVGAFAAIVAAQASSSPTTTLASPATAASLDPAQATYIACLKGCRDDDVNCRAKCGNVPFPNEGQANATNICAAACPKGKGTEPEVIEWNKCVANCVEKNFWASSGGTPSPTGASGGSGSGSGSGSSGSSSSAGSGATGGSGGSAAKTSGTTSGSGTAQTNAPNPANALRVGTSAVGLVGFMAAFLIL